MLSPSLQHLGAVCLVEGSAVWPVQMVVDMVVMVMVVVVVVMVVLVVVVAVATVCNWCIPCCYCHCVYRCSVCTGVLG